MSRSVEGEQGMYREVHGRLVQTGEWDRILALLAQKLNESGWIDDLRHKGKETARGLEPLKFRTLLEQVEPHAHASIPLAIKQEILNLITQFLENQFEP
ncbi:transcription factor e(y)2-domain-containing protein [Gautieria morchelliformis]|nr:transcription factor e(y)2-domain-containing protein [Gautieria morchelliformis]